MGVNQSTSGQLIPLNLEFIRLSTSQPILKIETSGFDQKFSKLHAFLVT